MPSLMLIPPDEFEFVVGWQEKSGIVLPETILAELGSFPATAIVAWGTHSPGLVGVSCGTQVIVLRKKKVHRLLIRHELPAKGGGSVTLEAVSHGSVRLVTLLHTPNFGDEKLAWLVSNKRALENAFGLKVHVADSSFDC